MAENKKGFFYIPTGILILLLVVTIGSLFFEFYFFTNIENFETITVNGKEYSKGSEQYESAIKVAKNIIMTSGLITLAIFIDGRKCIRIPDKKRKIQFFLFACLRNDR